MSTSKFADTHNLVAFLEKPKESNGFEEIIDFLNASSVQYALTVSPIIYTSCIEQFWATAKVKMVNGERQLQAIVDKKKVVITETSIRSDLNLEDAGEVTLVDETQEMDDDNLMFDTGVLEEQEIKFEKVVEEPVVSVAATTKSIPVSAAEVVTTASTNVEIPDELTLAQTLIEIKTAKPKPVTTAATTVTSVRPRAKGIIFHDQEEQVSASTKTFSSSQSQLSQVKDKGKGIMVEPEVPLKKKDQVALDEEMVRNLEAQLKLNLLKKRGLQGKRKKKPT
ncbi:hypothetical protein Tco_0012945 [Tanacetum coccineum]